MSTKIQWTKESWNPIAAFDRETGKRGWFCVHASTGCLNCYAEGMNRFRGNRHFYRVPERENVEIRLLEDVLLQPLSWRRGRMVFPCSMTDLFYEAHTDEMIAAMFAVMALARWHTFQVLTKRVKRMRELLNNPDFAVDVIKRVRDLARSRGDVAAGENAIAWPLPNVWGGVSTENQAAADERIPELLLTPLAVRWISAEPLLGPVDLNVIELSDPAYALSPTMPGRISALSMDCEARYLQAPSSLDWVVTGGESGAKARPCDLQWIRSIVAQCRAASVPVFVKQLGAWISGDMADTNGRWHVNRWLLDDSSVWVPGIVGDHNRQRPGRAVAFRLFDSHGGDINEWPEDLKIREFPAGAAAVPA